MTYLNQTESIQIIGIEIRTTNDGGAAFQDIPRHWERFFQESILDKIPNKRSNEIYGIYTNFEQQGENNNGIYSCIIGASVTSLEEVPENFVVTTIPVSNYQVFSVEPSQPEKVGEKWQEIWAHNFEKQRTFTLEYERYSEEGPIEIFVGVK